VVLPYTRPGKSGPLTLVPDGATSPAETDDVLPIRQTWRVIATMNVFDKSLLFEMSYALMRRFAFIEVPSPQPEVFAAIVRGSVKCSVSGSQRPARQPRLGLKPTSNRTSWILAKRRTRLSLPRRQTSLSLGREDDPLAARSNP